MKQAEVIKQLIKKYFWEMQEEASLSTGKEPVLPEEALDFLDEYFESLSIDPSGFDFRRYFPNEGIWFLPNKILPEYMKTDHHQAEPLTVKMLIEAAEAGHWLDR